MSEVIKNYYLEGNTIRIIRYIISYTEEVKTDTLERTAEIKQFLNSLDALEVLKARLDRLGRTYKVTEVDVSNIQHFDGTVVGGSEEARQLIAPSKKTKK